MKTIALLTLVALLTACSLPTVKQNATYDAIDNTLKEAANAHSRAAGKTDATRPAAVDQALLPPLKVVQEKPAAPEPRFDLVVTDAPAAQVFMAIVSNTPYSMLVHPEVAGTLTLKLKNATVLETMETIRELYGYDYTVQGHRIMVQPLTMQTRVFQINYLASRRQGMTNVRVSSGSITNASQSNGTSSNSVSGGSTASAAGSQNASDSSRIETTSDMDFWKDVASALGAIIGTADGRKVIVNPGSGVIVVRAFAADLRNVERYLRATQVVVDRQVMLEAKIVEVQLSEGFSSGINWGAFDSNGQLRGAVGATTSNFDLNGNPVSGSTLAGTLGSNLAGVAGRTAEGLFGLAFRTPSFASLLQFLETQGNVQVLSSPRIATINNQKAVLKVGTDEFFITNVSTTTSSTGSSSSVSPTITVQPFFSGIALDVTPQIDENGIIILHIHPSISTVTEKNKTVNLGTLGTFNLPLASSNVSETDSVVRVADGNIVAIGGLMKQVQSADSSQVPGAGDVPVVGALFGQKNKSYLKRELVVLIKPTVIQSDANWQEDAQQVQQRVQALNPASQKRQWME
ncbi:MAG: pilus (MSHA type) biogenesis protein MshL [Burkholderiaceae bacterium]|nr:MAG: pilus (MSHA type) biogenesis protein MshL [Burkholderiaceae bacterium]